MPVYLFANIQKIDSMQEAKPYFDEANPDTIVVFDIDFTLTMSSLPAYQMGNIKKHKGLFKTLLETLNEEEKRIFSALFISRGASVVIEPMIIQYVQEMQSKNIKVLALTATLAGPLGDIPSFADWRYEELKKNRLEFSTSFLGEEAIILNNLQVYQKYFPVYKRGILFCNHEKNSKGEVLKAFLTKMNWTPKRVISLDDDEKNVESLEKVLRELGIDHRGLHYKGAQYYPCLDMSEPAIQAEWKKILNESKKIIQEGKNVCSRNLNIEP